MFVAKLSDITLDAKLYTIDIGNLLGQVKKSHVSFLAELENIRLKKSREDFISATAREINRGLTSLATEEGYEFPSNRHHGEIKKCFDRNYCCLRLVLKNIDADPTVSLIIVPSGKKENSQTRKRSFSMSKEANVTAVTFDNIQSMENTLTASQKSVILAVANDPDFNREKCQKILKKR